MSVTVVPLTRPNRSTPFKGWASASRANASSTKTSTMGVMKTEPSPSDREVLAGLVDERVTYQNAENGFCVIR
jgi:hypothetical protein